MMDATALPIPYVINKTEQHSQDEGYVVQEIWNVNK